MIQLQVNTALDVLNSKSPSFAALIHDYRDDGVIIARAILTIQIGDMLSFFSIGQTMSDRQVAMTVDLILKNYTTLKPDDIKLCFERAMIGAYGKQYNRIDGAIIFEWLDQFILEKNLEIEEYRKNENIQFKKLSDFHLTPNLDDKDAPVPMPDYMKDFIRTSKMKKMVVRTIEGKSEPKRLTFPQLLMARFDKIYLRQMVEAKGGRFIRITGKTMDVNKYLEYKISNRTIRLRLIDRKRRKQ